jgi:hypothetical protein
MGEMLNHPTKIHGKFSNRFDLGPCAKEQKSDRGGHYIYQNAALGRQKNIGWQQIGAKRVAFKACANAANLSIFEQSANFGDEIAVAFSGGQKLDKDL